MNVTPYIAEQRARQAMLNSATDLVKVELQKLGVDCVLDVSKSEEVGDARFIRIDGERLNIRAHIIGHGRNADRIEWHGYAHRREHHSSDVPRLGETTSAKDAPAKRIARAILSKIIEPAREAVALYNKRADEWDAHRAALPEQVAKYRALGFKINDPAPGATEADFYISDRKGVSGTVRLNSDGKAYLDRVSLDAETARCVLEFLAARPKG